jgi:hypothetical protein
MATEPIGPAKESISSLEIAMALEGFLNETGWMQNLKESVTIANSRHPLRSTILIHNRFDHFHSVKVSRSAC